jgi:NAD(P)-dependent dehydrogenase (short-subunit alcohol dehydrogenase family)
MPTVLITGANRGLGLDFARQYAADGWRVLATCRAPDAVEALGAVAGDVSIHGLDVANIAAIDALAAALDGASIDLLLNNAGVIGARGLAFGATDYDSFAETMRANVMGPLAVAERFLPHVLRSTRKLMVSVSSRLGSIGLNDWGDRYIYSASKAALNAVMKSAAVDLAEKGVTVAVLHPGWVQTDMGGPEADLTPEESVTSMRRVIAGLTPADSGRFLNCDGAEFPW